MRPIALIQLFSIFPWSLSCHLKIELTQILRILLGRVALATRPLNLPYRSKQWVLNRLEQRVQQWNSESQKSIGLAAVMPQPTRGSRWTRTRFISLKDGCDSSSRGTTSDLLPYTTGPGGKTTLFNRSPTTWRSPVHLGPTICLSPLATQQLHLQPHPSNSFLTTSPTVESFQSALNAN